MHKILLVDDDPNLLSSLKRQLRRNFKVDCALGPGEGFARMAADNDYAVIVSDMRMPEMDGVTFLSRVANDFPAPTRIMLTGNADQQTAIEAVNKGKIFQFLNKPCDGEILIATLTAAVEHFILKQSEKELLESTLAGSVKLLMDVLEVINPVAFGRVCHMKPLAVRAAKALGARQDWQINIATLVSSIGWISIPEALIKKQIANSPLSEEEAECVRRHVDVAYDLLRVIPRMEDVAGILRYQDKNFDGSGYPEDDTAGDRIPLGARILKVLNAITPMGANMYPRKSLCDSLPMESGKYDPAVISVLSDLLAEDEKEGRDQFHIQVVEVPLNSLMEGDMLEEDLLDDGGSLLLSAGHRISGIHLAKLQNHPKFQLVGEKLLVSRMFQ